MNKISKKGVLLAGGKGSRLYPSTLAINKHLIPVYDKPLIYYSLSTLMLAGCRNINIVVNPVDRAAFEKLLGDGSQFGIKLCFTEQEQSNGIAEGLMLTKSFIGSDDCYLCLGDNIFFGPGLSAKLQKMSASGSTVLGYQVADPERFGVAEVDGLGNVSSLMEKPAKPKSNIAVVGLYHYRNSDFRFLTEMVPSARGELEITDFNNFILRESKLSIEILGRGYFWADTGTFDALLSASHFIKNLQDAQNYVIGSPDEIAYRMGFISKDNLIANLAEMSNSIYAEKLQYYTRDDENE